MGGYNLLMQLQKKCFLILFKSMSLHTYIKVRSLNLAPPQKKKKKNNNKK